VHLVALGAEHRLQLLGKGLVPADAPAPRVAGAERDNVDRVGANSDVRHQNDQSRQNRRDELPVRELNRLAPAGFWSDWLKVSHAQIY